MRSIILMVAGLVSLGGCVRFGEITDQTAPVAPGSSLGHRVSFERCMFSLLYGIPFGPYPLAEAKARAVQLGGGGPLVDVDVETDWIFAVVGSVTCVKVSGLPAHGADSQQGKPAQTTAPAVTPTKRPTAATPRANTAPPPPVVPARKVEPTTTSTASVGLGSAEGVMRSRPVLLLWIGKQVVATRLDGAQGVGTVRAVTDDALELNTPNGVWTSPLVELFVVDLQK